MTIYIFIRKLEYKVGFNVQLFVDMCMQMYSSSPVLFQALLLYHDLGRTGFYCNGNIGSINKHKDKIIEHMTAFASFEIEIGNEIWKSDDNIMLPKRYRYTNRVPILPTNFTY